MFSRKRERKIFYCEQFLHQERESTKSLPLKGKAFGIERFGSSERGRLKVS